MRATLKVGMCRPNHILVSGIFTNYPEKYNNMQGDRGIIRYLPAIFVGVDEMRGDEIDEEAKIFVSSAFNLSWNSFPYGIGLHIDPHITPMHQIDAFASSGCYPADDGCLGGGER